MIHNEKIYSNKYEKLKVLSTLPQPMPILVPTQHHLLKMPMKPTHHVLPTPPMKNCAMSIEMTTMSRQPQRDTEDKSELAEMQIVNARRRQRTEMSAKAEHECRADNPNIFNNVVYEPNTKTWVVHERRTKSYQQKRKYDQH